MSSICIIGREEREKGWGKSSDHLRFRQKSFFLRSHFFFFSYLPVQLFFIVSINVVDQTIKICNIDNL